MRRITLDSAHTHTHTLPHDVLVISTVRCISFDKMFHTGFTETKERLKQRTIIVHSEHLFPSHPKTEFTWLTSAFLYYQGFCSSLSEFKRPPKASGLYKPLPRFLFSTLSPYSYRFLPKRISIGPTLRNGTNRPKVLHFISKCGSPGRWPVPFSNWGILFPLLGPLILLWRRPVSVWSNLFLRLF